MSLFAATDYMYNGPQRTYNGLQWVKVSGRITVRIRVGLGLGLGSRLVLGVTDRLRFWLALYVGGLA